MAGFLPLLRKELREQWRTARLPVAAVVFLLVGFTAPLLAKYTPEIAKRASRSGQVQIIAAPGTAKDAIDQLMGNLGQFGLFAAVLLGMGMVAREKERGTAALVLAKPVDRTAFLGAKFLALTAMMAACVAAAGAAAYFYTAILFETLPVAGYIACCLLTLLALLVYAALTFLGSTLVRSSLPAAGIGLAAFAVTAVLSSIPEVGRCSPLKLTDAARPLALGHGPVDLAPPLISSLALIAGSLALAWWSFRGQEIGG
jgi:ABC-2 type transport system permease protein